MIHFGLLVNDTIWVLFTDDTLFEGTIAVPKAILAWLSNYQDVTCSLLGVNANYMTKLGNLSKTFKI